MKNNGNNEKCAGNDDTTSDNSMIPIISPTSPKKAQKQYLKMKMKDCITNMEQNRNQKKKLLNRKKKILIN